MGQSRPIGDRIILVVEDEALLRFDMIDFFEERDWRVFEASDADEAMALLDKHSEIRVVLTDVDMPGSIDGLRLAHYIRERFPPTQLIVVSGKAVLTSRDLPARATFMPKPFDLNQILRHLERGTVA